MKLKYLFIITILVSIFSCTEELDINRDPDALSPDQVPLNAEFPAAASGVATSAGSYFAIVGGLWSQFYTQSALANQYKNIDDYSVGTNDLGGAWSSMYDALLDASNVKKNAEAAENWNYYLMATVVEAYGFQMLTDMYGAVPFSEALNAEVINPVYDEPSAIYDQLVSNIQDALSKDFASSNMDIVPGNDDLIFGGNMTKWKQFANTLLLKLYLRQTNSRASVAQGGIQALYTSGAQFLDSDAAITSYVNAPDRSNPLYETNVRQLNVGTNLRTSTTMYSFLTDNSDTRLGNFFTSGSSQAQGDYNNAAGANVGVAVMAPTDPVYFISAAESYFLQAEADLRYNGGTNAQSLYDMGVLRAFSQFGLDGSSFVSGAYAYPSSGSMDEKLTSIITQKWVSFYPGKGYESFIEQNRTGIPANSSVPASSTSYIPGQWTYSVNGVTGNGNFPKRIVYPQSESQSNSSFPGLVNITAPNWYE